MAKAKAVAQKKGKGKQAGKAMDSNLMDTPMGKGKTPTDAPKGKGKGKGSLKIDIMLMKAMPGVGPDGKAIKGKAKRKESADNVTFINYSKKRKVK